MRRGKRVKATLEYKAELFAVLQTYKYMGETYEERFCADPDNGVPFLYSKDKCDPGQLEYGFETYVPVTVTIRAGIRHKGVKQK